MDGIGQQCVNAMVSQVRKTIGKLKVQTTGKMAAVGINLLPGLLQTAIN